MKERVDDERSVSNASKALPKKKKDNNKRPEQEMDDDELWAVSVENEKLINQLLEFTDEMETWLGFLK